MKTYEIYHDLDIEVRLLTLCFEFFEAAAHRSAVTALPSEETFGAVDSGEAEELGRRRRRHLKKKPGWYRKRQTGNLSKAQKQILRELWPNFGIELKYGVPVDLEGAFGQEINGLVLEVGFGMGEALTEMAAARPALSFVGVEWHRAGLASALKQIRDLELRNAAGAAVNGRLAV
eukprot:gene8937-10590_t